MESDSSFRTISDNSVGKLKELLKLESKLHKDTGQCYDTLQKEYDDLLCKYAQAENTIDKLRIETLRERIEKCKEHKDNKEILEQYNRAWQCVYDDLLYRTNKLQNAVTEFQGHLANHEYTGEEVNDIFDSLHTDFENIANAFQSMQALGIRTSYTPDDDEEHPEESILADDLEGNLYRLGLRLEEIQDEIGDKLRNDGIQLDENSNYSVSPRMLHRADSNNRCYEGECSETETRGNNMESDDDVNLELYNWKPATEDITELNYYKKQLGKQYLGLDPMYLSRSNSAPGQLSAPHAGGPTANTPNDCVQDLPKDSVELNNSQRKSRKSPTLAVESLNLKKSPTPERESPQSRPNAILTSTEDSGFLEGSHPSQQTFPSRHATSPLRINEGETASFDTFRSRDHQGTALEESAGERYRQRLDSLRSYILAKRASNNSPFTVEITEKKTRNFARVKRNGNRNSRTFNRMNSKLNGANNMDLGSSTTESVLSSALPPMVDEKAMSNRKSRKEETPAIQREDIDTLRDEMRGVRDIVLDLKNSLASPNRSPSQSPVTTSPVDDSPQVRSLDNLRRDEIDSSQRRSNERVASPKIEQHKQFEMLEKLDKKLDDISKKLKPSAINQRQSLSRGSGRVNGRVDSPSRHSHISSYYNQTGEENFGEINGRPNVHDPENREEYIDTFAPARKTSQQTYTLRPTENFRNIRSNENVRDGRPNENLRDVRPNENVRDRTPRYDSCDNFVLPRDNYTTTQDAGGNRTQVYTHRPVLGANNMRSEQRQRFSPPPNYHVEDDDDEDELNGHDDTGEWTNLELNNSTNTFDEKFLEIGQQMKQLSSRVKESKESEERRLRDETLKQQKKLVEYLGEKLEKLSTRIEEKEKTISPNAMTGNVSTLPVYVIPCPMCGHVGVHQHGGHFFNGHHIIELPENGSLGTTSILDNTTVNSRLLNTNAKLKDATLNMNSTPKKGWESELNRPASPKVYHHYHTVYSPPQEIQPPSFRQSSGRTKETFVTEVNDVILTKRICNSLEKASLAALHMENLSKKMLRGISTDLFNSGPSEF